ncbi:hypothetical protein ABZ468_48710 [Streptomyces sp. NPDC005708]|uniref:hypothetical protein n=1 Tax=Streptomyces sp. NPDC005708 TaxID=3154564 RepID=UPI0033F39846
MSLPAVRASASALVIALLVLSGCRAETPDRAGSASRSAEAVAPLADSAVGAALANRSGHPYSARFMTTGGVQRMAGFLNLGARTSGEFAISSVSPDQYKETQEVLLPDHAYLRRVNDRGETVKGWWRDPLTKAPPGNQIVEMHTMARLLARQPANAHARPVRAPSGATTYRLTGWIDTAALKDTDPRTYVMLAPRPDVPGAKGVRCTAWVDMQGRVVRFDEDLVYPDGSEYRSVTTLTGFDGPLPVHPPATPGTAPR